MELNGILSQGASLDEGTWMRHSGDVELKIAPVGGRRFQRALQRHTKIKTRLRGRRAILSEAEQDEIQMQAAAEGLLLDWRGITNGGEAVPYSPARGLEVFKANHIFYSDVIAMASDAASLDAELEEEAEGNSGASSSGSSSTPAE